MAAGIIYGSSDKEKRQQKNLAQWMIVYWVLTTILIVLAIFPSFFLSAVCIRAGGC